MAVEHSTLTTTDLHEPKGVAAASADQLYIAGGAGSGTWTNADNNIYLSGHIDDISAAQSDWVVAPCTGVITKIQSIISNAITGGDATLTFEINGTVITSSNIIVTQSGSAAGDVDTSSPSAANVLAVGDKLELITNGGSTDVCRANIMFTITPT
jgi:hypothetical protein